MKKDHAQYSVQPEDYVSKPIFVALKGNRLLNEFFLYVLEDHHTCGAAWCVAGASTPVRETTPVPSDDEGITPGRGSTDGDQALSLILNFKLETLPIPSPGRA